MKNGYRVMDSDLHVMETGDLYERYLDERYRDRMPQYLGYGKADVLGWQVGNQMVPPWINSDAVVGPQKFLHSRSTDIYAEAREKGYPPETHLAAMDVEGVDVAVLYRTLAHTVAYLETNEPDYAMALCRAFNDWLADYAKAAPDRLKGAAILTIHDPELAAEEARRAVRDLGFVAAVLMPMPINGRNLNAPECDALWAELERLNVPVGFHPTSTGTSREYVSNRFAGHPNFRTLNHAASFPLELMMAMGTMIVGGVCHKFPGLRIGFLEGTCGWLPWWLHRLDDQWQKYGGGEAIKLDALPSEYFRRQCYVSTDVDEELLRVVVDEVGDDNIVVSTDYPHEDGAYPHAIEEFLALPGVSTESKRKILWDNCARLYGLDVPARVRS
ncbi:MAG TPA: amidohydrolase family protein [Dehalococcoidia bacterium]|nr:amidohydrolase family protein [Dehalococcoidia bacterium]